jgi:Flp pilus assembly protein CpaB
MVRLRQVWRNIDYRVRRHRRLVASALLGFAVLAVLHTVAPPPPKTVEVVTAARDLDAGTIVARADVQLTRVSPGNVPRGAIRRADPLVGTTIAAPQRAGTTLTDLSIVQPGLLAGYGHDLVAAPVRIADSTAVGLLRVGERVAIFAASARASAEARVVVDDAPVIALPSDGGSSDGGSSDRGESRISSTSGGAVVVLAVSTSDAAALAGAAAIAPLSLALRGPR